MRKILAFLLLATPIWAAYSQKGTVTFVAASTTNKTNFTEVFSFSDTKLATTANGGLVTSTGTRVGVTVPNDVIFTSDASCATLTGSYTWGYEDYSTTTGVGHGWIMIPSLTTASAVTINVCVGNSAVTTYQGGTVGKEFDTNTQAVYHLPNGSVLSANDFSSLANNSSSVTSTAATGKIDGGAASNGTTQNITIPNSPSLKVDTGDLTISLWFNQAVSTSYQPIFDKSTGSGIRDYSLFINAQTFAFYGIGGTSAALSGATFTLNAWHQVAMTRLGTSGSIYLDGALYTTFTSSGTTDGGAAVVIGTDPSGGGTAFNGSVDEFVVCNISRSADWIADMFTNQSSPPTISALTATVTTSNNFPLIY